MKYVTHTEAGEGLIFYGNVVLPFVAVSYTHLLYGRMIEIYLYCSVSPIPFATMTNREWGQIGNNYLKMCIRDRYCPDCAGRMKKIKAAERKRKQRQRCHALEPFKPA